MPKLKVNLYSFGRESFRDEVRDLDHELSIHGVVASQIVTNLVAQFTFETDLSVDTLKRVLEAEGFTEALGLSVNLYDKDFEFEGQ